MNNNVEQATDEIHRSAECDTELISQHETRMTERVMKLKETFEAAFSNTIAIAET